MNHLLSDIEIRESFSLYYQRKFPKCTLVNEVRVCNGYAIADMVSLSNDIHCYEIKSDLDKISRTLEQAIHYDKAFRKITLITTESQLAKAMTTIPYYWGIVVITNTETPKIRNIRKATNSPLFNKKDALTTLWKTELLSILKVYDIKLLKKETNRNMLTSIIADKLSIKNTLLSISSELKKRNIDKLHNGSSL